MAENNLLRLFDTKENLAFNRAQKRDLDTVSEKYTKHDPRCTL